MPEPIWMDCVAISTNRNKRRLRHEDMSRTCQKSFLIQALAIVFCARSSCAFVGYSNLQGSPQTTSSPHTHAFFAIKKPSKGISKSSKEDYDAQSSTQMLSRRQVLELSIAGVGLGGSYIATRENEPTDYGLWGILPIGTYKSKPTIMETIVPNTVWTMDQKFGILNVQVPLRMTVLKLKLPSTSRPKQRYVKTRYENDDNYCLLLYNPIAPTPQCVSMIRAIEMEQQCHVRHIFLGSVALEHKAYAGVMAQKFPYADVWLTPGQYAVPLNLPEPFLGFPAGGRTKTVPTAPSTDLNWPGNWETHELESATLGPIISRDGAFCETVLYHRPTRTLLVTDTCLQVTDEVPAIYDIDPSPLLFHARDTVTDIVQDTPATRVKGWRRLVLFGLFFMPSAIVIKDVSTALSERRPDINPDFAGIYPWDWVGDEAASWAGLTGTVRSGSQNKPLVAPILQVLLLNRSPVEVLDFADRVAQWDIQRIIPAHLKNNLSLSGQDYRNAFGFLEEKGVPKGYPKPLDVDLQTLRDAEVSLIQSGAIAPAPPKVGNPQYSRADIIAQTTYRCRSGVCAPKADP
jgi:Domain of unknown function (DUF4336)